MHAIRRHRSPFPRAAALAVALCVAWLAAPAVSAEPPAVPDWPRYADRDTVVVVTHDEDGEPRETTVWLAVVDGQGYLRTGSTHWGSNLQRDPRLELVLGEERFALAAGFVEDPALRERIEQAFHAKYGFQDSVVGAVFHGEHPLIVKLEPLPAS